MHIFILIYSKAKQATLNNNLTDLAFEYLLYKKTIISPMGISQSLQRAVTTHPRFSKVQYGLDADITVIHFEIQDHEFKLWRSKLYHRFLQLKHWENQLPDSQIQLKLNDKYPYLLVIKEKDIRIVREGFCSEKYKLLLKVNKLWETTLQQQILNRKSIQRYFSQEEIWLMLFHIVVTILPIHEKSLTSIFGNLHPTNILINVHGQLMLIGEASLPNQKDHFYMFKKQGAKKSFISPELIGFVSKRSYKEYPNYPSCVDPQKVQSYALGLILLQLCCLQTDLSSIYLAASSMNYIKPNVSRQGSSRHNYSNLINQQVYSKLMHLIETRYSRLLSMAVKCLLQDTPEDRMSIKQLWAALLNEKKGFIQGMDEHWYLQALETIEELNGVNQQEEKKSQYIQENDDKEYKSTGRYQSTKGHYRIGSMEWESVQMDKNTTDSHIRQWERSLEKQSVLIQPKKVPKIHFTYL